MKHYTIYRIRLDLSLYPFHYCTKTAPYCAPFGDVRLRFCRLQCCNRMFIRPLPLTQEAASSRVSSKFFQTQKICFNSPLESRRRSPKSSCVKPRVVDNSLFSSALTLFRLLSVKIWFPAGCALQKRTMTQLLVVLTILVLADALVASRWATRAVTMWSTPPWRSYKEWY